MAVHYARVIALAAVLVGMEACRGSERPDAEQTGITELLASLRQRREVRALAAQGDAEAQSSLGSMYAKGEGVTQDDAAAVRSGLRKTEGHAYICTAAQWLPGSRLCTLAMTVTVDR